MHQVRFMKVCTCFYTHTYIWDPTIGLHTKGSEFRSALEGMNSTNSTPISLVKNGTTSQVAYLMFDNVGVATLFLRFYEWYIASTALSTELLGLQAPRDLGCLLLNPIKGGRGNP